MRAAELIKIQNEKLAEFCAAMPGRFVAFAAVALQHPQRAVGQLEYAIKGLGLPASRSVAALPGRSWPLRNSTRSGPRRKSWASAFQCSCVSYFTLTGYSCS
jgi:hypothetical protein